MDQRPPYNIEAEQAVVGCCLIEPEAALIATALLKPDEFWADYNRFIFEAVVALVERGEPVDMVSVMVTLRSKDQHDTVGGLVYLQTTMDTPSTAANVAYYCSVVAGHATRRRMLEAALVMQARALAMDQTVEEVVRLSEADVLGVVRGTDDSEARLLTRTLDRRIADLRHRIDHGTTMRGIGSGFTDLDYLTGGFGAGELIILGARSGVGKSALGVQMALHAAQSGKSALVVSLEMNEHSIQDRVLCSEARVNLQAYKAANVTREQLDMVDCAEQRLKDLPLWFLNPPAFTPEDLRRHCRRRVADGLGFVMVDYLGLMSCSKPMRDKLAEVTALSEQIKRIASEFGVPILLLSQLNREADKRSDKRPVLADLRDSGAIEANADMVLLLYREKYYERAEANPDPFADQPDPSAPQGAELILAKNRQGPYGNIPLLFMPAWARFETKAFHWSEPDLDDD